MRADRPVSASMSIVPTQLPLLLAGPIPRRVEADLLRVDAEARGYDAATFEAMLWALSR